MGVGNAAGSCDERPTELCRTRLLRDQVAPASPAPGLRAAPRAPSSAPHPSLAIHDLLQPQSFSQVPGHFAVMSLLTEPVFELLQPLSPTPCIENGATQGEPLGDLGWRAVNASESITNRRIDAGEHVAIPRHTGR
jgi:hypothetical protein